MKVVFVVKGPALLPTFNCFAAGSDVKKDKFGASCPADCWLSPADCFEVAD